MHTRAPVERSDYESPRLIPRSIFNPAADWISRLLGVRECATKLPLSSGVSRDIFNFFFSFFTLAEKKTRANNVDRIYRCILYIARKCQVFSYLGANKCLLLLFTPMNNRPALHILSNRKKL